MALKRINLRVGPVDTGKLGNTTKAVGSTDTGPNVWGRIVGAQITQLSALGPDTGCHIQLGLYPDLTDTGLGYLFYNGDNAGDAGEFPTATNQAGAPFTPVQPLRDKAGAHDTGAASVYAFGERIRMKLANLNDTGDYRVYVYVENSYG